MYAKGMTTRQISDTIENIYGFETSEGFISDVTDKILPQIEDWQNRPLDEVYPIHVRHVLILLNATMILRRMHISTYVCLWICPILENM